MGFRLSEGFTCLFKVIARKVRTGLEDFRKGRFERGFTVIDNKGGRDFEVHVFSFNSFRFKGSGHKG